MSLPEKSQNPSHSTTQQGEVEALIVRDLTQAEIQALFDYNPNSGILTWKVSRGSIRAGERAGCQNIAKSGGYRVVRIKGRLYLEHRIIWLWMTGAWPVDQVDHANRQRSDNRWQNLRTCGQTQNNANIGPKTNNLLGLKGVSRNKKRFKARIKVNGKTTHIGTFDTPAEAHAAFVQEHQRIHGVFSRIE